MLTEMQSVVAGMRKHSCGEVAAYAAVCCFSDVGVVVGSGWKADEDNLDYTEVEQEDSQQPKGSQFAKKGLKMAANVVKGARAFAKDSVSRMSSSDSGSEQSVRDSVSRTSSNDSGSEPARRPGLSRMYSVPGRLCA